MFLEALIYILLLSLNIFYIQNVYEKIDQNQNFERVMLSINFSDGTESYEQSIQEAKKIVASSSENNDYIIRFSRDFPINNGIIDIFKDMKARNIYFDLPAKELDNFPEEEGQKIISYNTLKPLLDNKNISGVIDFSAMMCFEYKLMGPDGKTANLLLDENGKPKIFSNINRRCDGYEQEKLVFQKIRKKLNEGLPEKSSEQEKRKGWNFDVEVSGEQGLRFTSSEELIAYLKNAKYYVGRLYFFKERGKIDVSQVIEVLKIIVEYGKSDVSYEITLPENYPVDEKLFNIFKNMKAKNISFIFEKELEQEFGNDIGSQTFTYHEMKHLIENKNITGVIGISGLICFEYNIQGPDGKLQTILYNTENKPRVIANANGECNLYEKERKIFQKLTE